MDQQERTREAREADCDCHHSDMMMMMMMGATPHLNCQYIPQTPPRKMQSKAAHVTPPMPTFVTQPPVTLGQDDGDERDSKRDCCHQYCYLCK
eukprot:14329598-Ditylum_brightwellii.AAC.1